MVGFPPFDLVCDIVELCGDDRVTFTACSLVSSTWRRASQHTLFSSVFVTPTNSARNTTAFRTLLETREDLAHPIRRLNIGIGDVQRADMCTHVHLPVLLALLQKLPNLTSLHIDALHVVSWPQAIPLPSSPRLKLHALYLHRTDFEEVDFPWQSLSHLLGIFHFVELLETYHLTRTRCPRVASIPPFHLPRISSLKFDCSQHQLGEQLWEFVQADQVLAVDLTAFEHTYGEFFQEYQNVLRAFPGIKHLKLAHPDPHDGTMLEPVLDLQHCRNIESIQYNITLPRRPKQVGLHEFYPSALPNAG
ncbi:hypothetical protein EIP91_010274 [Steccherinum ochraceum]|uniref:F-box domain-containing protein n=1 Tax=Steccherinum ochraceum TaxID=92696 RepID=A0A4R0RSX0_9APHY|nr:hypothetical protein EIP91_010274 [Steccherinum ochraceum]